MSTLTRKERAQKLVEVGAITPERACHGKHAYPTRNDARHAAKGMARMKERVVEHYKCPFCDSWHLTKLPHGAEAA